MYNFVEKQLFSMLIFEIYPCIIDGLGKSLHKLYVLARDFFFTSALLWLCQLQSKQLLIENSYLLWKTGWVKYCKATPNCGLCPVAGQAVQNLSLLLCGWLHWTDTTPWSSRQSAVSAISSEEASSSWPLLPACLALFLGKSMSFYVVDASKANFWQNFLLI